MSNWLARFSRMTPRQIIWSGVVCLLAALAFYLTRDVGLPSRRDRWLYFTFCGLAFLTWAAIRLLLNLPDPVQAVPPCDVDAAPHHLSMQEEHAYIQHAVEHRDEAYEAALERRKAQDAEKHGSV